MNTISYDDYKKSYYTQGTQNSASSPSFSALDTDKLKEDTLQLSQDAKESVGNNWVAKTAKNVKDGNIKKILISIAATLATVIGVAAVGNSKLSSELLPELGLKLDNLLKNSKIHNSITNFFTKAKTSLSNFLRKSKTLDDVANTMNVNKAKPQVDVCRGYGKGFKSIFALTPVDVLKTSLKKFGNDEESIIKALEKLVGEGKGENFYKILTTGADNGKKFSNVDICNKLTDLVSENFNCKSKQELYDVLLKIKNGETIKKGDKIVDLKDFIKIDMNGSGKLDVTGSWWPANLVNSIGKKIRGEKWKGFCRGNLGDSLIKYNSVSGNLADTKLGSIVQSSLLVPTESISNFVNDKSGFGVMLCATIMSLYNNTQDAPKGKRAATVADDFIGTIGSIAISTPLAFGATYGLASLKNLEGKTFFSKLLKGVGQIFGLGLDPIKNGIAQPKQAKSILGKIGKKMAGISGGGLRFYLIMFVFAGLFSKPIRGIIHKIFGKPYDKNEEEKQQQLEEQKKQVIPELNITMEELEQKVKNNPEAVERMQNDPELVKKLSENPKLILNLLDNKPLDENTSTIKPQAPKGSIISPANQNLINARKNNNNSNNSLNAINSSKEKESAKKSDEEDTVFKDTATYIPSSEFSAKASYIDEVQTEQYNEIMEKADKALKRAEKYI